MAATNPVDQLIQFCLNPPSPDDGTERDAMREFIALARAAVRTRPEVGQELQRHVGWLGDGVRPGQSVSPSVMSSLAAKLMALPAPASDANHMLARVRSMPSGVQLPAGGLALSLNPASNFVTPEDRREQADRLHKAQVAVRQCLNMPTEEMATKRRAENIEQKLHAEAMSHAPDDTGRKEFYETKLNEIYKKMHALVRSHQQEGPGRVGPQTGQPPGAGAPFASLASQGLTPQGSFAGALVPHGMGGTGGGGQQPMPGAQPLRGPAESSENMQTDPALSDQMTPGGEVPTLPQQPAQPAAAAGAGAAAAAAPGAAGGGGAGGGNQDNKEVNEYWKRLDKLRPHRNFAMRYIQTLDKFTERTLQDIAQTEDEAKKATLSKKRKVAENVRKYLWLLCRLCNDDPNKGGRQMPPNLRLLDVIHKTLEAVYKRQRMPDAASNNRKLASAGGANRRTHRPQYTQGAALIATHAQNPNSMKFDYDVDSLTWSADHRRNKEDRYCYCGTNKQQACVQCTVCKQWFHKGCTTDVVPKDGLGWVEFQVNYRFTCKICCSADNIERFELTKCSWLESILGGFQNLMYTQQREMFKAAEITAHLDKHWDALCHQRDRGDNKKWRNSLNSYLTNNMKKFERPKKFFWALANPEGDPQGPAVQPCRLFESGHRNEPPAENTNKIPKSSRPRPKPQGGGGGGGAMAEAMPTNDFPIDGGNQPWDMHVGGPVEPGGFQPDLVGGVGEPWDASLIGAPSTGGGFDDGMNLWEPGSFQGMDAGGGLMSPTSLMNAEGMDEGMPMGTAPIMEEEDNAICPKCNLGPRNFGSAKRNQYICVKCDQDEHEQEVPDLEKAKIPNNQFVWNAEVTVGDDPVPYKVTICHSCKGDVTKAGSLNWKAKDQQIPAAKFRQEQYEDPTEEWVECEFCNNWYHQVCVRFDKQIYGKDLPPVCPNEACRLARDMEYGSLVDMGISHTSADLQASPLSKFLEDRLESEVFAETERSGNHGVTVRVVTNVKRKVDFKEVSGKVGGRYQRQQKELPYMMKNIFAFYRCADGAEVAFFALQVQEYGKDCPAPNTNTAYISYLDANQLYHCPGCGAHDDVIGPDSWTHPDGAPSLCTMPEDCKRERRQVYDTLFVGYMEYLKRRGLHRAYIWVMPPETAESDYVFYYRPREMHIPSAEQLENWYIRVLEKAQERGAIDFFEDNTGRRQPGDKKRKKSARRNAGFLFQPPTPRQRDGEEEEEDEEGKPAKRARTSDAAGGADASSPRGDEVSLSHMPIFKGDHMAGVIEQVLLSKERKETGNRKTGNSARAQKQAEEALAAGGDDQAAAEFGRTLSKSLVDEVTHFMTDETQGSYIRCHFEAAANDEFKPDLEDDPVISIDAGAQGSLDERENLIRLCAHKHYQFNTMRCAKFSTMLLTHYFLPEVGKNMEQVTSQQLLRSMSKTPQITAEVALHRRLSTQMTKPSQLPAASPFAAAGGGAMDTSAASNEALTNKWQAKLQRRKSGNAAAGGFAAGSMAPPPPQPANHSGAIGRADSFDFPAPEIPRSTSMGDLDSRLVDQLGVPLQAKRKLEEMKRFVASQQQAGTLKKERVSKLVTKLVELLGIEAVTSATNAVVCSGEVENMLLRTLKDRLTPQQRSNLDKLMAGGDRPAMDHIKFLQQQVDQEVIVQALCEVIDFLMKQAMFDTTGFGATPLGGLGGSDGDLQSLGSAGGMFGRS